MAYWVAKKRTTSNINRVHAEAMAIVEKQKQTDEKNRHCDMSLYLMQKSVTSNDAYELDEWLKEKGLLAEYNLFLDQLSAEHQKKFNMSKAQLIALFEDSYLQHYEKLTEKHEAVLCS